MSDRDVILMDRENDRLADEDDAIEDKAGVLYFDAADDLARKGRLFDDEQNDALDERLWAGHAGGIDAKTINTLAGFAIQAPTLDHAEVTRRYAAIGRCIVETYQRHLLAITEQAAVEAVRRGN